MSEETKADKTKEEEDDLRSRVGSFSVAPELILQSLQLPDDAEIIGAEWDYAARAVRLFIRCPDLKPVPAGKYAPAYTPTIYQTEDVATGDLVFSWTWGEPIGGQTEKETKR